MLRSQSISNFSDSKKKGFLSSLRSRKSSNSSLNSASISAPTSKPRPLSLLASSMTLNRHVQDEFKENLQPEKSTKSTTKSQQRPVSVLFSNAPSSRSLKTRLSTPNLKRSSVYLGTITAPESRESITILPDAASDKLDEQLLEDSNSPYTPEAAVVTDTIPDVSTISIEDEELDLKSLKLHRTTNYYGISDFVLLMLHDHVDRDAQTSYLPINNRKSLDIERLEQDKIRRSLQMSLLKECKEYESNLQLVENALFISISSASRDDFLDQLEDLDYAATFKSEPYIEDLVV